MDKLKAMATFIEIVDRGSLSAAAEAMDRSPASVVRALADLENHLGIRLLNRSTRRISLTDEGRDYLLRCRRILADINEAEFLLDARRTAPAGKLTVTAPMMFGRLHLIPLLNQYLAEHPGLQVDITLVDRVVNIIDEGFDIAIRIGHLADSSLISMPLGLTAPVICASPALIKQQGTPNTPNDLASWPIVRFNQHHHWAFKNSETLNTENMSLVMTTNQVDTAISSAIAGLGVTRLFSYQVAQALEQGQLIRLLPEFEPTSLPVQFVYPHNRLLSYRVRAFLDWAGPQLKEVLKGR
ncbi:LysR family transcriptional regulator [Neptunomonas phycophila]|uniref:LysR family transcriptional regulator n=1 Tax=Neptunomonas TaxID=75687 RepID=UPI000948FCBF|nr:MULTISPECIES: LysR family transcriptional regulator [Neptunomonas]MBT3145115.1 LysR family transcriptional regulator [Neptunomonas phycophila]MDN2659341.1 LysR family transcriptional regulator [Neptunomonas sp. CHC150]MDO6784936.1 LysR family transcriptional regulator [Neptunomonas phycophila]